MKRLFSIGILLAAVFGVGRGGLEPAHSEAIIRFDILEITPNCQVFTDSQKTIRTLIAPGQRDSFVPRAGETPVNEGGGSGHETLASVRITNCGDQPIRPDLGSLARLVVDTDAEVHGDDGTLWRFVCGVRGEGHFADYSLFLGPREYAEMTLSFPGVMLQPVGDAQKTATKLPARIKYSIERGVMCWTIRDGNYEGPSPVSVSIVVDREIDRQGHRR